MPEKYLLICIKVKFSKLFAVRIEKMKVFKFRVEDSTYVRWNFGGISIKDYLYSSSDQSIQRGFELTLEFKKALDAKLNNQPPSAKIRVEISKLIKILKSVIRNFF